MVTFVVDNLKKITNNKHIKERKIIHINENDNFSIELKCNYFDKHSGINNGEQYINFVIFINTIHEDYSLIDINLYEDEFDDTDVFDIVLNEVITYLLDKLNKERTINVNSELYEVFNYFFYGQRMIDFYDKDVKQILESKLILDDGRF